MAQEPYEHQLKGLELLRANPRYALFWDCGVGKTLSCIMAMNTRLANSEIDNVLIVCPKVAMYNWVNELEENSEKFSGLYVVEGAKKKRLEIIDKIDGEGSIVIMNYDILRLHPKLEQWVADHRVMLVYDESHYIKNGQAQRSKAAHRLADACEYVVLLTGTPIGRNIGDVWSQYRALDGGETFGNSWWRFCNYYMKQVAHVQGLWVPKDGSTDTVKRLMWKKAHLLKKDDCLSLPETTYTTVPIQMPTGQWRVYREMVETLMAEFMTPEGDIARVSAANMVAATMKLQQITSGFGINKLKQPEELRWQPKLDGLVELAGSICPTHKLVVWTRFRRDLAKCKEALREWSPLTIESEHDSETRAQACELFNAENEHRVIISNPQVGGVAINLIGGSYAVYFSNSYDWIHRKQSEDRLHRIGQRHPVQYIDLVVPGTIDETVREVLQKKQNLVDYLEGRADVRSIFYGGEKDGRRGSSRARRTTATGQVSFRV